MLNYCSKTPLLLKKTTYHFAQKAFLLKTMLNNALYLFQLYLLVSTDYPVKFEL